MAGVLTDNLVMQRARIDDIRRVKILNVCGAQLQDIGVLRFAVNLEVLSLSLNEISDLGAISHCARLRELYLRRNQVCDMNQLLHLTRLPELSIVNLSDNPICFDPNYRKFTIAAIPSLVKLDDMDISKEERRDAVSVFPELTRFAPPASAYAEPLNGRYAIPPESHYTQPTRGSENNASNRGGVVQRNVVGAHRQASLQKAPLRKGGMMGNSPTNHNINSSNTNVINRNNKNNNNNNSSSGFRPYGETSSNARNSMPSTNSELGPTELGVVQAIKVLCSELSIDGLNEVRNYIDSLSGY